MSNETGIGKSVGFGGVVDMQLGLPTSYWYYRFSMLGPQSTSIKCSEAIQMVLPQSYRFIDRDMTIVVHARCFELLKAFRAP